MLTFACKEYFENIYYVMITDSDLLKFKFMPVQILTIIELSLYN
ncbi:MAG: hypothetical protein H6Q69_4562 [Firmicutes bacterium]|nr:hypothetical protein [Bacillota bacterium]